MVAFGYSVCCGVSNDTKAQSVNAKTSQSSCLNFYNHTMLWATCCLGFFGFLHAAEFTVNSHFNPNIAVGDVQAESLVNSGSFRIYIKYSKMDSFC